MASVRHAASSGGSFTDRAERARSIDGKGTFDIPTSGLSDLSLSSANGGLYLDVRYSMPSFPVSFQIRGMGGDYSVVALGLRLHI